MNEIEITKIFTDDAVSLIANQLDKSEDKVEFFNYADDLVRDGSHLLELPYPISLATELDASNDADAALALFGALGNLDRANAADRRLWTYLALGPLRDYMQARWSLDSGRDFATVLKTRWMITRVSRRSLIRHGIARLWWVANLSYDPKLERKLSAGQQDEFAYTRWLFDRQDRIQNIFENELGSSDTIRWAMCEVAAEYEGTQNKLLIRKLAKELNAISGYQNLESFDAAKLRDLLRKAVEDQNRANQNAE